jgi:hypothetical protein
MILLVNLIFHIIFAVNVSGGAFRGRSSKISILVNTRLIKIIVSALKVSMEEEDVGKVLEFLGIIGRFSHLRYKS